MFGPKGPFCQSCGMPLSKDKGTATEADGSKNNVYCSNCYQNGAFVQPDLTLEDMQERVRGRMKEMHMPGFLTNKFVKGVAQLGRWKQA